MASNRRIEYEISVANKSSRGFDKFNQDVNKSEKNFKNAFDGMSKNADFVGNNVTNIFKNAANEVGNAFKSEFKKLANDGRSFLRSLVGAIFAPIKAIMKIVSAFVVLRVTIFGITKTVSLLRKAQKSLFSGWIQSNSRILRSLGVVLYQFSGFLKESLRAAPQIKKAYSSVSDAVPPLKRMEKSLRQISLTALKAGETSRVFLNSFVSALRGVGSTSKMGKLNSITEHYIQMAKAVSGESYNTAKAVGHSGEKLEEYEKTLILTSRAGRLLGRTFHKLGRFLTIALGGVDVADKKASSFKGTLSDITANIKIATGPVAFFGKELLKLANIAAVPLGHAVAFVRSNIGMLVPATLILTAAIIGLKKAFNTVKSVALEFGDVIDKQSQRVGFNATAWQVWEHIAKRAGTSMSELRMSIGTLSKNIYDSTKGLGRARDEIKALGIEIYDTNGNMKSQDDLFKDVIIKLSKMQDVTKRNAIAMKLFGTTGGMLVVPMLNEAQDSLEGLYEWSEKNVAVTNDFVVASAKFSDHLADLGALFKRFKAEALKPIIKEFNALFDILKGGVLFDGIFKAIGLVGKTLIEMISRIFAFVNAIVSTIDTVFTGITGFILEVVSLFRWAVLQIVKIGSNVPFLKNKLGLDATIKANDAYIQSLDDVITMQGKLRESAERTGAAFKAVMFGRPELSKPTASRSLNVDTDTQGAGASSDVSAPSASTFDLSSLEAFNQARMAILKKLADWEVANIKDKLKRQRIEVIRSHEERTLDVKEALTLGYINEQEAADAIVEINKWKDSQIRSIDAARQEALEKDLQETLAKQRELIKKNVATATSAASQSAKIIGDGFTHAVSVIESSLDAVDIDLGESLGIYGAISALSTLNSTFASTVESIGENTLKLKENAPEGIFKGVMFGAEEGSAEAFRGLLESTAEVSNAVFSTVAEVASVASDKRIAALDKEKEAIDSKFDYEKARLSASRRTRRFYERDLANLEVQRLQQQQEIEKEREKLQKESAKKQLGIQLVQSIASTALGVANALTMSPPPLAIAMAAIIGALGAVQIGLISSQMSKFATGGIVEGPSVGDQNVARVNGGEMILNKQQQRTLFDMANGRGNGASPNVQADFSITVNGEVTQDTLNTIEENQNMKILKLKGMLEELKYRGELSPIMQGI